MVCNDAAGEDGQEAAAVTRAAVVAVALAVRAGYERLWARGVALAREVGVLRGGVDVAEKRCKIDRVSAARSAARVLSVVGQPLAAALRCHARRSCPGAGAGGRGGGSRASPSAGRA